MRIGNLLNTKSQKNLKTDGENIKQIGIAKEQFGDKWPFKFNEATLQLRRKHFVTLVHNGKTYALNGLAIDYYKLPTTFKKSLVLPEKKLFGQKSYKSIGPIIEYALENLK